MQDLDVIYRSSKTYLAGLMTADAYQVVLWRRTKSAHKLKQWGVKLISNQIRYDVGYKARHHKVTSGLELGTSLVVTGGSTVIGTVVSGATVGTTTVAVMAAVAAGTFVISRSNSLLFGIWRNQYRRNRDWKKALKRDRNRKVEDDPLRALLEKVVNQTSEKILSRSGTPLSSLTVDASDAILRAYDHWSRAADTRCQLKALLAMKERTLKQTNAMVDAHARFIHDMARTQNYLLPCLDMSVLVLTHYERLSKGLYELQQKFNAWVGKWLSGGDHGMCLSRLESVGFKDVLGNGTSDTTESLKRSLAKSLVCYAPKDQHKRDPKQRRAVARSKHLLRDDSLRAFHAACGSVDVAELITFVGGLGLTLAEEMSRKPASDSYEAQMRSLRPKVYAAYDNPNLLTRMGHSVRNSWNRQTHVDRFFTVATLPTEFLLSVGTAALGSALGKADDVFKGAPALTRLVLKEVGSRAVGPTKAAASGIGTAVFRGILESLSDMPPEMKAALEEVKSMESGSSRDEDEDPEELSQQIKVKDKGTHRKEAKIASGALFKSAANHLVAAATAWNEVQKCVTSADPTRLWSCAEAFRLAETLASIPYQLRKVRLYTQAALKVTLLMTTEVMHWQKESEALWKEVTLEMDESV